MWHKSKKTGTCPISVMRVLGFTLIEGLFVAVVIAVLGVALIPRVGRSGLFERLTVYTVSHQIASDMRLARRLAVTTRDDHRVKFFAQNGSPDFNEYQIQKDNSGSWDLIGEAKEIDADIGVAAAEGDEGVTFSPNGAADAAHSYDYSLGGYTYTIDIKNETGRVKVEES